MGALVRVRLGLTHLKQSLLVLTSERTVSAENRACAAGKPAGESRVHPYVSVGGAARATANELARGGVIRRGPAA